MLTLQDHAIRLFAESIEKQQEDAKPFTPVQSIVIDAAFAAYLLAILQTSTRDPQQSEDRHA